MLTGCRDYRPRLIEMARGTLSAEERAALVEHLDTCASCARALDEQLALSAALDAIASEPAPQMPMVEARVLAEFDRTFARHRTARWIPLVGLAAALLLGVVWVEHRQPVGSPAVHQAPVMEQALMPAPESARPASSRIVRVANKKSRRQAAEDNQPFLPIPYTVPLGPEERTTIVRMEIPVAALIAAGFDMPAVDPGALVLADVLVGQDGRARAIRPVRQSTGK